MSKQCNGYTPAQHISENRKSRQDGSRSAPSDADRDGARETPNNSRAPLAAQLRPAKASSTGVWKMWLV